MDPVTVPTREIFWNIPSSYKVAMYFLLAVGLAVFFKGLYDRYKYVSGGKNPRELLPDKLNWSGFFKTLLLTGKVTRNIRVGILHGLIFYGFIILWIATDIVALHYDTPLEIFTGNTYIIISFLADLAGLAVILGIVFAYKRRYIDKPDHLSATRPKRELFQYGLLLFLIVTGFLLEGIRIQGTGMPIGEKCWAPIGWVTAVLFGNLGMSDSAVASVYRFLWLVHMAATMLFVASCSHSKFIHILLAPVNALVTPPQRGAILLPMDFEDEEAETFGLGKLSELTMKNRMDLLACVECGRCTEACPAKLSEKPLDPKIIITKMRDLADGSGKSEKEDVEIW